MESIFVAPQLTVINQNNDECSPVPVLSDGFMVRA
jgi:hypothetical protein